MKRITAAVAVAAALVGTAVAPAQAEPLTQTDVLFLKTVETYTTDPRPRGVKDADLVEVGQYVCYSLRQGADIADVYRQFRTSTDFTFSVMGAAAKVYCPDQWGKYAAFSGAY